MHTRYGKQTIPYADLSYIAGFRISWPPTEKYRLVVQYGFVFLFTLTYLNKEHI